MSIKKLVQTGEDRDGVFNVMDGLSFARAINNNADELETETKLDLEIYNTPEAIAKALKEQSGKTGFHTPGGPDDLPTFEEEGAPVNSPSKQEGGIAQIYNEALEPEPEPEPEPGPELEFPNPIPWNKEIEDNDLSEAFGSLINNYEETEESQDFTLKQGDNTFKCYLEALSSNSADIFLKDNPENNHFTITLETDTEMSDTKVVIGEITGFEDLVISR